MDATDNNGKKGDILWLHRGDMGTGLSTHFEDTSVLVPMGKLTRGGVTKDQYGGDNSGPQQSWI
jgi:hypothetical protein